MGDDGLILRTWREDDLDATVRMRLEADPKVSEEYLRSPSLLDPARFRHREVAVRGGEVVGYASATVQTDDLPYLGASILVVPAAQGRGVGSALMTRLRSGVGARQWLTIVRDDDPRSLAVAHHWGCEVVSRSIMSQLDLTGGVPVPRASAGAVVRFLEDAELDVLGIDIDPLLMASSTAPEDEVLGWRFGRAVYQTYSASLVWVVVEVGGRPVATVVADRGDRVTWFVDFTGVDPAYRRRGLARTAKELLHARAADEGARAVLTANEERNIEIRALNASMGYVPESGELRLMRPADAG
jgi:GNAT superfamily N-acetyltransferase